MSRVLLQIGHQNTRRRKVMQLIKEAQEKVFAPARTRGRTPRAYTKRDESLASHALALRLERVRDGANILC